MKAKVGLPERVRLNEGLGATLELLFSHWNLGTGFAQPPLQSYGRQEVLLDGALLPRPKLLHVLSEVNVDAFHETARVDYGDLKLTAGFKLSALPWPNNRNGFLPEAAERDAT